MRAFKLSTSTSLFIQQLPVKDKKPEPTPVNHYWVIDISGSMYGELPHLRKQLKDKIFTLVKPSDTVTLIAFSGRNECFTLFENEKIAAAPDKEKIYKTIDTYLTARGLTGFKQPLEEVLKSIVKLEKKHLTSLFFMTDGYDNQWSNPEILGVCKELARVVDHAVIVEYGWYCNHALLSKMAESLGGALLFSKELDEYQDLFEAHLGGTREKKISVKLAKNAVENWVFCVYNEAVLVVPVEGGMCSVPESCTELGYIVSASADDEVEAVCENSWAALAALSQQSKTGLIFDVLKHTGDVALVQKFTNCFSKEDYINFQKAAVSAHFNKAMRYSLGFDRNCVPAEDAYTVLDLLEDLSSEPSNLFYPYYDKFTYQKISAAVEQKSDEIRFQVADKSAGYPINSLTWNESRPNVSVQIKVDGFVTLPSSRPEGVPEKFSTFIFRNYTIIKDGIVHTRALPVSLSATTFAILQSNGLLTGEVWRDKEIYWLDFSSLPVINRKMVKSVNAKEFFEHVLQLQVLKGRQKVLNELKNKYAPRESVGFKLLYGDQATEWLKSVGLTDYSGFSPAVTVTKGDDVYVGYELKTAVKGASALPKVEDVRKAMASGKSLKVSEGLLKKAIVDSDTMLTSAAILKAANPEEAAKAWISNAAQDAVKAVRKLNKRLSQIKFSIIVGHVWFDEFSQTPGEASLEISVPDLECAATVSASLKEVEIKI